MTDGTVHLDGNCLAGPLSEILAVEPTTAWWRCPECTRSGHWPGCMSTGPTRSDRPLPGVFVHRPRLVREGEHIWLTMGGGSGAFRFSTA